MTLLATDFGEQLSVLERIIVAPCSGLFRPAPPKVVTTEGEIVERGQVIGTVELSGDTCEVRSPFTGFLMGVLAWDGDRVREGQPLAWLREVAA
jgi:biotin carboxyl carrier protein